MLSYLLRISKASPSKWKGGRGCSGFPPLSHRFAGGGAPPTTQRKDSDVPAAPIDNPPNDDILAGAAENYEININLS